eukprot:5043963-Pyramimonas_sp.AAC.1
MPCATCPADASSSLTFVPCVRCVARILCATGHSAPAVWSSGGSSEPRRRPLTARGRRQVRRPQPRRRA